MWSPPLSYNGITYSSIITYIFDCTIRINFIVKIFITFYYAFALIGKDVCLSGGYYQFDWTSNRLILDRASYDFGSPRWHLLDTLKVPAAYRGLRIVYLYGKKTNDEFVVSDELHIDHYE